MGFQGTTKISVCVCVCVWGGQDEILAYVYEGIKVLGLASLRVGGGEEGIC